MQRTPRSDLEIVGAGPAGLAAAIHAARRGLRVVVHERNDDVGRRFRDDFQGIENWTSEIDALDDLRALGIAPAFDHVGVREQSCYDPSGRRYQFRSERPFYYLVRRGSGPGTLDRSLKEQALALGVAIRFGSQVSQAPARAVVARGPRRGNILAAGYVFETDAPDTYCGVLDERLAPGGYGYLLVHGGRGTLATCMFTEFRRARACLEATRAFFERREGVRLRGARRFGGVGAYARARLAGRDGARLAGEAGGLQDAMWGFGLRYAMRSGALAAQRLGGFGDARDIARDERRLALLCDAGRVNRLVYDRLGNPGYALFLRWMARARDPRAWLGARYRPSALTAALGLVLGLGPRAVVDGQ